MTGYIPRVYAGGQYAQICPQNINIPAALKNLSETPKSIPSWAETCRQREKSAKQKK